MTLDPRKDFVVLRNLETGSFPRPGQERALLVYVGNSILASRVS